jgi:predicted TIM-barrel fold metal-dependent hydrolase
MIRVNGEDWVVADGVVHAYNLSQDNAISHLTPVFSEAFYVLHDMLSPSEFKLDHGSFMRDWSDVDLERILFLESQVDVAGYHALPLFDYYRDGLSSLEKGVRLRDRNPGRIILYGTVNPLEGVRALEELEAQVKGYGIRGVKVYPAHYYRGKTLPVRLDDPSFGIPLIEKAIEQGIRVIAVHKVIPFGLSHQKYYRLDDVEEVAGRYPEVIFEIVHGGFAFLEETAFLVARFFNVYVNLEVTSNLIINHERRFAEVLGRLLEVKAEDRVIFGTGCMLFHPRPVIEKFIRFQMPEDMVKEYGYPQVTPGVKRKILGENYLRMHNIDPDEVRRINDAWSRERERGLRRPWSTLGS